MNSNYSLFEWNIHKMTNNISVDEYVIDRILKDSPDIIVLVEYKKDDIIERSLRSDYFYDVGIGNNGNDVLMAIKKAIVYSNTKVTFNKNFFEENLGEDQPTILVATFTTKENKMLTVIALRYVQGGNGLLVSKCLRQYLDKIQNAFICAGDFNVLECRMPSHFENYYHKCYNGGKDGASVVMLNNFDECVVTGYNRLDHVIHNSHIQVIELNYPWDFTSLSGVYIPYDKLDLGDIWKIPVANPDHAILECKFKIN